MIMVNNSCNVSYRVLCLEILPKSIGLNVEGFMEKGDRPSTSDRPMTNETLDLKSNCEPAPDAD
jgi:hypothetical protein